MDKKTKGTARQKTIGKTDLVNGLGNLRNIEKVAKGSTCEAGVFYRERRKIPCNKQRSVTTIGLNPEVATLVIFTIPQSGTRKTVCGATPTSIIKEPA